MTCALCGVENPPGTRFCARCGVSLGRACNHCHAYNNPLALRCGACGSPLQEAGPERLTERVPRESRRIVTVLFADIVGYTSMVESYREREEIVRGFFQECFAKLAGIVKDYDGTVEKFIGDAVCAVFGAPTVHEDDPERALRCAMEMQRAVGHLNEERMGGDGAPEQTLALRIGISTGEVVGGTSEHAGQEHYSVTGDAVNTASRLQGAAEPGQIVVAASTERLVRRNFLFTTLGSLKLKGKRAPVPAFLLTGMQTRDDDGDFDLVDRRSELEHLGCCYHLACEGDPQLVEVVGEAGVGKSALVAAFARQNQGSALVLRGVCPPFSHGPLWPFRAMMSDLKPPLVETSDQGFHDFETLDLVANGQATSHLDHPAEAVASALEAAILTVSRRKPVLLMVEDVQRADPDSLELLKRFLTTLPASRCMLLWTRRTGEDPILEGDYGATLTRLALKPLSEAATTDLIDRTLGSVAISAAARNVIVRRSGGNPLYIEAMIQALLEDEALLNRVESQETVEVPATVQGLIQARLDTLPEPQRLVAQEAAVVGREFDADLLQRVDLFGLDVASALEALARRGMIEHIGGRTYRFGHVLTQEVAYETMLMALRSELHREIGDVLSDMYARDLTAVASAIADHYVKAGDTDRAVEILVDAAQDEEVEAGVRAK